MTHDREHRRRYGDKEVGLILKRAADLQREEPASEVEGAGLSLAELEEIAAEVGIDSRHIGRAATELDAVASHSGSTSRLAGAPLSIELERTIAGELSEDGLEHLIPEIQRAADGPGQPALVGRTLTWQSSTSDDLRTLQVSIASRNGRTRIGIEERYENLAWTVLGGIVGGFGGGVGFGVGLGVGIGALGSVLFSVAFPAAALGGSYLIARAIYSRMVNKRRRVLGDLLDRLTEEVMAATSDPSLQPQRGAGELPGN